MIKYFNNIYNKVFGESTESINKKLKEASVNGDINAIKQLISKGNVPYIDYNKILFTFF